MAEHDKLVFAAGAAIGLFIGADYISPFYETCRTTSIGAITCAGVTLVAFLIGAVTCGILAWYITTALDK
jgi:hypothetical protein